MLLFKQDSNFYKGDRNARYSNKERVMEKY